MPFPIDIKFVHDAERKLAIKFPAAFVNKMVKMNGGSVSTRIDSFELHPFMDASDRKRLARTCNDIVRETAAAHDGLLVDIDDASGRARSIVRVDREVA